MKPETEEWVAKAEGNWAVAKREVQAAAPVWDVVSFLAQQCAEQYLKALLEEHGIAFRKTHDLALLLNLSGSLLPELTKHARDLAYLTTLGIAARYPGTAAAQQDAEDAMKIAGEVRTIACRKLGIS